MYKIVGADGRAYGPVSADEIKRWIAEGRARGETLVQAEGAVDWRPLNSFPELAAGLRPPPISTAPPLVAPPVATAAARASNKIPAGVCGILLGGLGVHKFILGYTGAGVVMLVITIVGGIVTCGIASSVVHLIGLIEGIIYLAKPDEEFVRTYVDGRKEWF